MGGEGEREGVEGSGFVVCRIKMSQVGIGGKFLGESDIENL
jgi:hypothetical protein